MRVFAISDVHVDYDENMRWVHALSTEEYRDDALILAGDVSHRPALFAECVGALAKRFSAVLFVPGNHELWVTGEAPGACSLRKFDATLALAANHGAITRPWTRDGLTIVPLFGWYDGSFGAPSPELRQVWTDFHACRWPEGYGPEQVSLAFDARNPQPAARATARTITFSHFLPRLDLVPAFVPPRLRMLDPVLGSERLERRLRRFSPQVHVYGHSHINRVVEIDGVRYVNSALGYPKEGPIAARQLLRVDDL